LLLPTVAAVAVTVAVVGAAAAAAVPPRLTYACVAAAQVRWFSH